MNIEMVLLIVVLTFGIGFGLPLSTPTGWRAR
jgi:hypothetical protein